MEFILPCLNEPDDKDPYSTKYENKTLCIDEDEDTCPICNKKIIPNKIGFIIANERLYIIQQCPANDCNEIFISQYVVGNRKLFLECSNPKHYIKKKFDEIINEISPNFSNIYNQANDAEQRELTEICGMGYRKALEFLIKDYCIKNKPNSKEDIEKRLLGNAINNYVNNTNIKECAKRAAWLGNDETHYIRKWTNKDIKDLKTLIELTINWIVTEEKTKAYLESMSN